MRRVRIDHPAVQGIVDRVGERNAPAVARFLADEQRRTTRSRRLSEAVTFESGRDERGWYARAGMPKTRGTPAFFWYFEEFQSGRGGGLPFIRPSLFNNTTDVARRFLGGGL